LVPIGRRLCAGRGGAGCRLLRLVRFWSAGAGALDEDELDAGCCAWFLFRSEGAWALLGEEEPDAGCCAWFWFRSAGAWALLGEDEPDEGCCCD